ncbi:MAG: RNA polymerase sigma factor [Oligoflexia bacterium]|nr:RNA polymerase sigma factor [Oligoflexia bacterium]
MLFKQSDDELMEDVKRGSKAAFSELIDRHGSAVLGYCMRVYSGNTATAEDTTQEVWMKVLENNQSYKGSGHFKAWLMTITRNTAFTEMKKSSRYQDENSEEEGEIQIPDDFNLEEHMVELEDLALTKKHIDSLPDQQRMALILWLDGEDTYQGIAKQLNLSLASVKSLIFRARENIKKKLEAV